MVTAGGTDVGAVLVVVVVGIAPPRVVARWDCLSG